MSDLINGKEKVDMKEERSVGCMSLRMLLAGLRDSALVSLVIRHASDGAYCAEELLERTDGVLDMEIPDHGIEVYYGKVDEIVAEDSRLCDEYFYIMADSNVPYFIIELI